MCFGFFLVIFLSFHCLLSRSPADVVDHMLNEICGFFLLFLKPLFHIKLVWHHEYFLQTLIEDAHIGFALKFSFLFLKKLDNIRAKAAKNKVAWLREGSVKTERCFFLTNPAQPNGRMSKIRCVHSYLKSWLCTNRRTHHARGLPCDAVHRPAIGNILQLLFDDSLYLSWQRRLASYKNYCR